MVHNYLLALMLFQISIINFLRGNTKEDILIFILFCGLVCYG